MVREASAQLNNLCANLLDVSVKEHVPMGGILKLDFTSNRLIIGLDSLSGENEDAHRDRLNRQKESEERVGVGIERSILQNTLRPEPSKAYEHVRN